MGLTPIVLMILKWAWLEVKIHWDSPYPNNRALVIKQSKGTACDSWSFPLHFLWDIVNGAVTNLACVKNGGKTRRRNLLLEEKRRFWSTDLFNGRTPDLLGCLESPSNYFSSVLLAYFFSPLDSILFSTSKLSLTAPPLNFPQKSVKKPLKASLLPLL
ncbi:hypothetical protein VNO77_37673 [Canavalia gladiata]|uniref:Uncharacterized protein n=1 Tax=Canavalia gladiata TaxID=3824 RepID=A0AAN9K928_CANGL